MRIKYTLLLLVFLGAGMTGMAQKKKKKKSKGAEETYVLKDFNDTLSYAFGVNLGMMLKKDFDSVRTQAVIQGFLDHQKGVDSTMAVTPEEIEMKLGLWVRDLKAKAGRDFLAANKKKEGVVTTASGLQYKVLKQGDGEKPQPTSTVKTHYHGTLIDGTVFDSSVDRGEPISFQLNRVIRGWQEGLLLMSVGSKYRFFIPYELAYGDRGAGGKIGPFATLIFEVELLGVE